MAVSAPEIARIIAFLDQLANKLIGLQQAQEAEAEFNTLLQLGNSILDQVRVANQRLDQLVHRVAANQTQTATNALTLAQTTQKLSTAIGQLPGTTSSAVWQTPVYTGLSIRMADVMRFLEQLETIWFYSGALDIWEAPYFLLSIGVTPPNKPPAMPIQTPIWDITQVQASDTLLTFVSRLNPYVTWQYHTGPGDHVTGQYGDGFGSIWTFTTKLDEAAFQLLKAAYLKTNAGAPVWPGLPNVTLGTPVAIAPVEQTITGPLDGVIVQITGGYDRLPHYRLGSIDSYKALGTLTFTDDNGQAETFQMLGPVEAVYCPKTMVSAQTAEFRWMPGLTGTVTPWTRA
jgi:hypothetical protein